MPWVELPANIRSRIVSEPNLSIIVLQNKSFRGILNSVCPAFLHWSPAKFGVAKHSNGPWLHVQTDLFCCTGVWPLYTPTVL
jgi:hypothetical protein